MVVGGIGTVINLGLYWLLLFIPALKEVQWNFLGKDHTNYVLPFIISSLVATVSNYLMNRASTFKGWKEQKGGFTRYISMALVTLALDNFLLFLLVRYGNLPYVLAAALAIFINFTARFLIARNWVWKKKAPQKA
jgi:putative flippase GtrA